MRVYINKKNTEVFDAFLGYDFVSKINQADDVIIFLNNLGSLLDVVDATNLNKHVYLIFDNKDIFDALAKMINIIDDDNYQIEDTVISVVNRMEERKNEKSNNGKTRKLL